MLKLFSSNLMFILMIYASLFSSLNYSQRKNLYVSPSGNNSNSGLSIDHPLKTINKAIDLASAGDTIYIMPGTYKEVITFNSINGKVENPIYLCGYSNNEKNYPVVDGGLSKPSNDALNDWMHIKNSSWIEVSNLKFINGWTYPIQIKNSSYLTFRNCNFYGAKRVLNAEGINTHHILVEKCFWDQGGNFLWRAVKDSAGVEAWLSMHHLSMGYYNGSLIDFHTTGGSIVIRDNKIINAYNAIRFRGEKGYDSNIEIYNNDISNIRDNDFEPEYYTYNLHIYHNRSHNIHKTLSVDNVEGGFIYYYGNIVTSDSDRWTVKICDGVWKLYGSERRLSYPLYVFNNSLYTFGTAFLNMHGNEKYLKHFNNAYYFASDNGWDLNEWDSSDEFDYDLSNKPFPQNIIQNKQEAHGKISNVEFIDPQNKDLRLTNGSPAIDAGKVLSLKEFDWTQSYDGKAPDAGAYEDGLLVEGPPFRFLIPDSSKITYKEKPRIVRYYIEGRNVIIYFSDKIDTSSVNKDYISLFRGNVKLNLISVSFPKNNYQMLIETETMPPRGDLSLSFSQMPKGLNGESATYWASTIKINKMK